MAKKKTKPDNSLDWDKVDFEEIDDSDESKEESNEEVTTTNKTNKVEELQKEYDKQQAWMNAKLEEFRAEYPEDVPIVGYFIPSPMGKYRAYIVRALTLKDEEEVQRRTHIALQQLIEDRKEEAEEKNNPDLAIVTEEDKQLLEDQFTCIECTLYPDKETLERKFQEKTMIGGDFSMMYGVIASISGYFPPQYEATMRYQELFMQNTFGSSIPSV